MYLCKVCQEEVKPLGEDTYYEATVWRPVGSKTGAIQLGTSRPHGWAHGTCVRARRDEEKGKAQPQTGLF